MKPFEVTEDLIREIAGHREKQYYLISDPRFSRENQGRLLFMQHELMVTRFHAALVLASRRSDGAVRLVRWAQGQALNATVSAPKTQTGRDGQEGTREFVQIPLRPDALFTLELQTADGHRRFANFFYEADRMTMSKARMVEKFKAYAHCILQQKHRSLYGLEEVRAVLIETLHTKHARTLCKVAVDYAASACNSGASVFFWFTAADAARDDTATSGASGARAFAMPEYIFSRIWTSAANRRQYSLLDS